MTDLTEQWKKGELALGMYYVRLPDGHSEVSTDCDLEHYRQTKYANEIKVLAPVPSYEEWKEYQELDEDYKKNVQLAIRFSLEAEILKELLKQSRIYVKIETEDYDDRTVSKADKENAQKLLQQIDEALK